MIDRNSELNCDLFKTEPVTPMGVHLEAWRNRMREANTDPFDRYAFYASRSLFVRHPEIYLRADRMFYAHVSTVPGYRNAFLENDRESMEFLPHAQYYRSAPFSFDIFPWEDVKTTASCRSLYPERYPFFKFADRRMLPLATTLKTTHRLITELEMASMRFQCAVDKQGSSDNVFILYAEDGKAWIADKELLYYAATGEPVKKISENIILVFNDQVVWYPLMERDDSTQSKPLISLLKKLSLAKDKPRLTVVERELLNPIRTVTTLTGEKQEAMATIAAVRSTGRYTHWFKFHRLWDIAMPASKERAWQYYGYLEQILIRANSLSPISAYIAACSRNATRYDKILCIDREWVDLAALPNHNYVWGYLWDECLVECTIDETFRINAGECMAQTYIISAILEMAGVKHYLIEEEVPGSHHYIFIPDYEFTFDNGKLQSSQNTIHWNGPRGNRVIARLHYNGKFTSPIAGGHYSGTFSPEEAVEVLQELHDLYGDTLRIYINGNHETNKERVPMEKIPTTDDYTVLRQEDWEPLTPP